MPLQIDLRGTVALVTGATPMNERFFESAPGQEVIQRDIPMRRLGEPAELGPTIVYLASEASSFMTGSVISIDGGHTLI